MDRNYQNSFDCVCQYRSNISGWVFNNVSKRLFPRFGETKRSFVCVEQFFYFHFEILNFRKSLVTLEEKARRDWHRKWGFLVDFDKVNPGHFLIVSYSSMSSSCQRKLPNVAFLRRNIADGLCNVKTKRELWITSGSWKCVLTFRIPRLVGDSK